MKNSNTNQYTFKHTETINTTTFSSFGMSFLHATTLTKEILIKFTQEFYETVISKTTSTVIQITVTVTFNVKNRAPCTFTLPQYVNKTVQLSVLLEIIFCFWYNLQQLGGFPDKVTAIYIQYNDIGNEPVRLYRPTPENPTVPVSCKGPTPVCLNPIFPGDPSLYPLFANFEIVPLSTSTTSNNFINIDHYKRGLWNHYRAYLPNTILTNEIISLFTQDFYDNVLSKTNNTLGVMLVVNFADGTSRSISYLQYVNKDTTLSDLDGLFNFFWSLRSSYYHQATIESAQINYRNFGSAPIKLVHPTKDIPMFVYNGFEIPTSADFAAWGGTKNPDFNPSEHSPIDTPEFIGTRFGYSVIPSQHNPNIIVVLFFRLNNNRNPLRITYHILDQTDLTNIMIRDGQNRFTFLNGEVVSQEMRRAVGIVKPLFVKRLKTPNDMFITFDFETRTLTGGEMEVISASISTDGITATNFYLLDYASSEDLIKAILKFMTKPEFDGYVIYAHNFSNFDSIFILRYIAEMGKVTKLIIRDRKLIDLELTTNNGIFKFRDSLLILPQPLDLLTKAFDVEVKKGKFPYSFVNNNPLDYIGEKPPMYLYSDISPSEYDAVPNPYDLRKELLKYNDDDAISLYLVLRDFIMEINNEYKMDVLQYPTLPSLAFATYRAKFIKTRNVTKLNGQMYHDLKLAYYGGMVDAFLPYGENLYLYDINSQYPAAMKKPIPVGEPIYKTGSNLDPNQFGFFYAKVEVPYQFTPPLPFRGNGLTLAPTGTWDGWYFSEELKDARDNYGVTFTVSKAYIFKAECIFDDYVDKFYAVKRDGKGSKREIAKLFLNSLYGRWGLSPDFGESMIIKADINSNDYEGKDVSDIVDLGNDFELISFNPTDSRNLDTDFDGPNCSVVIAAAIGAYSRMMINVYKNIPGNKCFYSDTDSVILQYPLDDKYVGPELGQMKLEASIVKGVFLAPKVYGYLTDDGEIEIKCKGLKNPPTLSELESLLTDKSLQSLNPKFIKDLPNATVNVRDQIFTLSAKSEKRYSHRSISGKLFITEPRFVVNNKLSTRFQVNNEQSSRFHGHFKESLLSCFNYLRRLLITTIASFLKFMRDYLT